ncbi:beta-lactamase/transpeptidase-like protein, partial [Dactylonectria macrodidyma]
ITLDSTFWGFSCTKLLTTICVLQCVERSLIGLDDEVCSVLPELANPNIINAISEGPFELTPAKSKITVRHLLTHTSGLSYDAMHPVLVAWRKSRGEPPLVMSGKVDEAFSLPLLFEPGSGWVYGAGLDWAGVLVERINSNTKLADYMEEHVFKPLGLERSTFHLSTRPDISASLAQMWNRTETGELIPIPSPYPVDARDDSGGMGLITSTADFIRVLRDLLQDKPVLLKPETVSEIFTAQFEPGSPQYRGLLEQEVCSFSGQLRYSLDDTGRPGVAFGLGGMVVQNEVPNLPAKTLTWNGMPNIGWFVNRERGLGAIYVSQVLPAGDPKSVDLLAEFWREIW